MDRIRLIRRNSKTIVIVDHSNCKESEMIGNVNNLMDLVLKKNQPVFLISVYNDRSYATPDYMRVADKATAEAIHLVEKHAVVGLNHVKKMILKGYNHRFSRDVKDFADVNDALRSLLNDPTVTADD
jgi:hypothetical protein